MDLSKILSEIKFPLKYDGVMGLIHDANGRPVLEIKLWKWLMEKYKAPEMSELEEALGNEICKILNEHLK